MGRDRPLGIFGVAGDLSPDLTARASVREQAETGSCTVLRAPLLQAIAVRKDPDAVRRWLEREFGGLATHVGLRV